MGWVCSASLGKKREMAEAAYEALDLFDGSGTAHLDNGLAIFGIGLYAALGRHKPKKFTTVDVEYTLVRVEAKVVLA